MLYKNSKSQGKNEIDFSDLFENFFPGNRVQVDYCEKGNEDFLVMVSPVIAAGISQPKKLC